ncbi:MFS transporter [uncultured Rhodoblastus sp.]|uniref:MFS transporter n=1 Tax=uncultured Rhodoblastus sp. TaxID=543037 RepID=UPI0025EFE58D|nr:MFS transporter [uncultured Rhodoblastus sp.]
MTETRPTAAKTAMPAAAILIAGCLVALLSFGPRSVMGAFQLPVFSSRSWGAGSFSIALAAQNLLWGVGQPFAGALADRLGSKYVLIAGAALYAAGLALMGQAQSALGFELGAGVLIGFGLSGASFNLVLGAFAKLLPPEKHSMAFGLATAAGSFGQFLFSPLAGGLIEHFGWEAACMIFAALILPIVPLSLALSTPPAAFSKQGGQGATFARALAHRSYVLLVLGFFTCGFQLAFITVHFQRYIVESGLSPQIGYWAIALVGVFNIFGSLLSGWLGSRMPRRYILSAIYFSRALATALFIALPPSPASALLFGAVTGLLWLSTVPPTSSLIGLMFGSKNLSMLYGFAFFSHQLGGFLGVLLGGFFRESTGSYLPVWLLSIALGVLSALVNLPIVEAQADPVAQPAE